MRENNIPVFFFEETVSTNISAREYGMKNSSAAFFVAEKQTGGMGRKGRSFVSNKGGIYLSYVFPPKKETRENILRLTTAACVTVCDCIEAVCDISPKIKWVNDIYYKDKKVCGILTQGVTGESGEIESVVIGIGINFHTSEEGFPEELKSIAGSLYQKEDEKKKKELTDTLIAELQNLEDLCNSGEYLAKYREKSMVLGKEVRCYIGDRVIDGVALDIDENGGLKVMTEDGTKVLSSGEITLRLREGAI